nr:cytochrome P450 [Rhodococcus pyridinivorans]
MEIGTAGVDRAVDDPLADAEETRLKQASMLLDLDPPEHTRLGQRVSRGFTPRMGEDARGAHPADVRTHRRRRDRGRTRRHGDRLHPGDLGTPAAGGDRSAAGAPAEDVGKLYDWSNRMIGWDDPEYGTTQEDDELAAAEIFLYANEIAARRHRTPTCPASIGDQQVERGDNVIVYYPSANRDEEVFDDAHVFDIGREHDPHVAFGGTGVHFCLGGHLARFELRIMFETLIARIDGVEPAGEPRRLRSNFINGIKSMPVRIHRRER